MTKTIFIGLVVFAATLATAPVTTVSAQAAKFELKASTTIADILRERIGKRTTIRMQSGEDIEGTVVMVGNSVVHVEKLAGKDFYDAAISLDRISAVMMRVR